PRTPYSVGTLLLFVGRLVVLDLFLRIARLRLRYRRMGGDWSVAARSGRCMGCNGMRGYCRVVRAGVLIRLTRRRGSSVRGWRVWQHVGGGGGTRCRFGRG